MVLSDAEGQGLQISADHIIIEQANRLFDACDSSKKGFVIGMDLGVLDAYLSETVTDKVSEQLEKQEHKYLTREQFTGFLMPYLRRSSKIHRESPATISIDLSDEESSLHRVIAPQPSIDPMSTEDVTSINAVSSALVEDVLHDVRHQLETLHSGDEEICEILIPNVELGSPIPLVTKTEYLKDQSEDEDKISIVRKESGVLKSISELRKRNSDLQMEMSDSVSSSLDKEEIIDLGSSPASLDAPDPLSRPNSRMDFVDPTQNTPDCTPKASTAVIPDASKTTEIPMEVLKKGTELKKMTWRVPSFLIEQTETPTGEKDFYSDLNEDNDIVEEDEYDDEPNGDAFELERIRKEATETTENVVDSDNVDDTVLKALAGKSMEELDEEIAFPSRTSSALRRSIAIDSEGEVGALAEALGAVLPESGATSMVSPDQESDSGFAITNAGHTPGPDDDVMKLLDKDEDPGEEMPLDERPSMIRMGEVVTLADELSISAGSSTPSTLRSDMISPLDESYPYRVENCSPIGGEMLDQPNASIIKRRHFRPLLPDLNNELVSPSKGLPQSLADELQEAQNGTKRSGGIPPELDMRTPDRIFKVVFVGDSAVGKTCFLHRFCHNRFRPLFNATIGVDFTVKTVQLRDRLLAVQLWDTAGQERFRSITKQYFRKADGVVLMYDVTSEQSFLHVRNWIDSVKQGVDESTVMCLVGNKVDLYANDQARTITYKMGKDIAKEFNMLFFETSAFTGFGINECMLAMAERLQKREEMHLEEALKLEMNVEPSKRSWCCV